jgi:hypothetical protein
MSGEARLGGELRSRRHEQRNRRDPLAPLYRDPTGLLGLSVGSGLEELGGKLSALTVQAAIVRYQAAALEFGNNTPGDADYFLTKALCEVEPHSFSVSSSLQAKLSGTAVGIPPGEYMLAGVFVVENARVDDTETQGSTNAGASNNTNARIAITNPGAKAVYASHTSKTVPANSLSTLPMFELFSTPVATSIILRAATGDASEALTLDRGYLTIFRLGEAS